MKIYATRLGMIPSWEITYALRVEAERQRRREAQEQARRARSEQRAQRWRERWLRARAGLGAVRRLREA